MANPHRSDGDSSSSISIVPPSNHPTSSRQQITKKSNTVVYLEGKEIDFLDYFDPTTANMLAAVVLGHSQSASKSPLSIPSNILQDHVSESLAAQKVMYSSKDIQGSKISHPPHKDNGIKVNQYEIQKNCVLKSENSKSGEFLTSQPTTPILAANRASTESTTGVMNSTIPDPTTNFQHSNPISEPVKSYANVVKPKTHELSYFNYEQLPEPQFLGDLITIKITESVYQESIKNCASNLRGRFTLPKGSKPITTAHIRDKLNEIWKPCGNWRFTPIRRGFFDIHFDTVNEKQRIWSMGSLNLKPGIFKLFPWEVDFNPEHFISNNANVWVKLYGLPLDYWSPQTLFEIAKCFGTPIRIDKSTSDRVFGHYARILVDMDISKPLADKILVAREGFSFTINAIFENIPAMCRICNKMGHSEYQCNFRIFNEKKEDILKEKIHSNPLIFRKEYRPIVKESIPVVATKTSVETVKPVMQKSGLEEVINRPLNDFVGTGVNVSNVVGNNIKMDEKDDFKETDEDSEGLEDDEDFHINAKKSGSSFIISPHTPYSDIVTKLKKFISDNKDFEDPNVVIKALKREANLYWRSRPNFHDLWMALEAIKMSVCSASSSLNSPTENSGWQSVNSKKSRKIN